jgi:hypothetical protein
MATVAEIITYAKRKKYSAESDANLIIDLQGIQDEIFLQLKEYEAFGNYSIKENTSVAAQLEYDMATNQEWENTFLVRMSEDTTVEDWYTFEFAGEKDDISTGYKWQRQTADKIALYDYGQAVQIAGLTIQFYYNKTPAAITLTNQTPDLKPEYHNLYKYALIQLICEQGDNPDIELANLYKQKYYEFMEFVKSDLSQKALSLSYQSNQKKEIW